jgi:hypothetical protein
VIDQQNCRVPQVSAAPFAAITWELAQLVEPDLVFDLAFVSNLETLKP